MEVLEVKSNKEITENKIKVSGAEAVIRCLLEENVKTIFGYPGGAIMPIYDALYDFEDQIQHILQGMSKVPFMQQKVWPESADSRELYLLLRVLVLQILSLVLGMH